MAKFQSPLLGYNNNVRHKNRVFHIQTEDSGVNHPHIITHLFMDGGRILKSVKKSYAEHVGADGMKEIVRGLMKEQHKAIFIALRDGQFDTLVDGGTSKGSVPPPAATAPVAAPAPDAAPPDQAPEAVAAEAPPAEVPPAPISEGPLTSPDPIPPPPSMEAPPATIQDARRPVSIMPPSAAAAAASKSALMLDFDALEQAAQDGGSPSLFHAADLPPPPKNLFAKEPGSGGAYRAVEVNPAHAHEDVAASRNDPREEPESSGPVSKPQPRAGLRMPGARPAAEARYAPARPAAIFGSTQRPPPASLFSDELVSDKSLDEVILSYLAEDLEPPRRK
ncbi:MAG TPA: hypothetical protein VLT33_48310 [Labilithrix sp.]|nr:hypothetical protein [Labilithrix sp.]